MPSPSPGESGAITAEWVITLPALVMVAALLTSGLGAGVATQRLQAQASDHARVLSLGGDPTGLPDGSSLGSAQLSYPPDLVCVRLSDELATGLWALAPLRLHASACALDTAVRPAPGGLTDG
ncbi:MAG: hypothetical protein K9G09_00165 [Pontimonas sp.]|nr:hypothetical protein [Pontimonas sp.]